jgi:hypothetical protein
MGEIIPLRPRQGARTDLSNARNPIGEGVGASILLFTGVRYERHEDVAPANTPRPSGRGASRTARRKRA